MARFIFNRLWQSLISIFILIVIVFILARVTGNPVNTLLPVDATEEQREYMTHELGLDKPYYIQFFDFIGRLVRGDLGDSVKTGKPVINLYFERLPNTLTLVFASVIFAIIIAIPLGVLAGSHRGSWIDHGARFFAVIGIAAPNFWVALVLITIFSVHLGLLPAARISGLSSYILPGFSLSFFALAGMARLLRSSMVETMDGEFVKLARIKGVSQNKVVWQHCLRNSLIPVISFLGMYIAMIIGGTVVIETVFAWPGAGRLAYEGIIYRDYPVVQCVVMMHAIIIVFINLVTDIVYSYVDPRIRYA
jgi:peptide/nickel transport system permease protein